MSTFQDIVFFLSFRFRLFNSEEMAIEPIIFLQLSIGGSPIYG